MIEDRPIKTAETRLRMSRSFMIRGISAQIFSKSPDHYVSVGFLRGEPHVEMTHLQRRPHSVLTIL